MAVAKRNLQGKKSKRARERVRGKRERKRGGTVCSICCFCSCVCMTFGIECAGPDDF